ncbi:Hpt domain-containing protein [Colwelliaceae bacterium 6471]
MSNFNQLDMPLLQGYLENLSKNVVAQMLDLYITQSKLYLIEIAKAVDEESQSLWEEQCHKMKGAAGSAGLIQVHKQLVTIEKSTDSWALKQELLKHLCDENEIAIKAFQEWLA